MKRGIVYVVLLGLSLVALWLFLRHRDGRTDAAIVSPVLQKDERAKIILDEKRHVVTRVERGPDGRETVVRSYLNPHGPVAIAEKADGKTVLTQRSYGTCASPFVGGAFGSDFTFRAHLGLNLFYVQRWELGGGLLLNFGDVKDTRAEAHLSYNAYSNWLLSVGVDNRKTVHLMAGLRF